MLAKGFSWASRVPPNTLDRFRQIQNLRVGAEKLERAGMHLAGQDPHEQALEVCRRPDRPHPVGDVAKAVLEVPENPVVGLRLDGGSQNAPQFPVHCRAGADVVPEQEWQIYQAQFRYTVGEITAGLVAEGQDALLHQPEDIQPPVTEIQNVVDVAHFHVVAETGLKPVAHAFQSQAEAGRGRAVPGHDDAERPICLTGLLRM